MVGHSALSIPMVVSAAFVLIALLLIHGLLGWHKDDMAAVAGEVPRGRVQSTLYAPPLATDRRVQRRREQLIGS